MRLPSTSCLTFLFFVVLPVATRAQLSGKDSLIADSAYADALDRYHTDVAPETGLYRGPQYVDYDFTVQKGHPFFGPDSIRTGTIRYNGILYEHVSMLYDLVREQVVIIDPYKVYKISPFMDLVDGFTIGDHRFIRVKDSLDPFAPHSGYYERLYQGRIILLKKEKKTMQENLVLSTDNIRNYIDSTASFYLRKEGTWYAVNSKRLLQKALKDRRAELKKFIRDNDLSWQNDKEQLLLKVAIWYDGLNH